MKKAAKKASSKGINKTQGKTTTGVISDYAGYKGKGKKTSATGRSGPAFKKGGSVKK